MKIFIKLSLISFALFSFSQSLNADEKKDCSEYKKLSKEYLTCTAKKIGKSFRIDGKTPSEAKDEILNKKD
tara:strand:- start:1463 stop:1675 length:213 start_codon:yes stop_codon:yes gene_type:complete